MTSESDGTPKPRPKRQPPVIDAEAKDVTPPPPESEVKDEAQAPEPPTDSRKKSDLQAALLPLALAAVCGVASGFFGAWLFAPGVPQTTDTSAISNSIAQLSSRLTQQETKPVAAPDLTPLNERSAKLEAATGALRGELAEVKKLVEAQANVPAPTLAEVNSINRRLAQIEEKVGTLAALPKPEPKNDAQPAEVIALGALRDAVVAGAPFAAELSAVRAMLKDRAASLNSLDQFAKDGLPTVAALAKRFEPLAAKLASAPVPAADSGVFTRLWNNAGKLVEVRPVGEPQGSDAGAVVARMETKLARGDLTGALEESEALPQSARAQAKDWFAAAEQRRDADVAIKNLINAALAAISAERPKQ